MLSRMALWLTSHLPRLVLPVTTGPKPPRGCRGGHQGGIPKVKRHRSGKSERGEGGGGAGAKACKQRE
jgi:hypothetical protein